MLKFEFADYQRLIGPTEAQITEWKDYAINNSGRRGLSVVMEASHAGMINENIKFYIPSRMMDGMKTFRIGEKKTKILKNHKVDEDPIGVVTGVDFVSTVPEDLANDPNVLTLMSDTASMKEQLAAFRKLYISGAMDREDWKGLGYLKIYGDILDEKAIQQIQDGRYDAVSTHFVPGNGGVYCSGCSQNLIADGLCDHINPLTGWGKLISVDEDDEDSPKVPALPIPERQVYKEVSLVGLEGDKLATIKMTDSEDNKHNKTFYLPEDWRESCESGSTKFEFKDFKEDMIMDPKLQKVFEIVKKLRQDMEDTDATKLAEEILASMKDGDVLPDQEEAGITFDVAVQYAIEDYETKDQEINADEVYSLMEEELDKLKFSDKKLSVDDRKRLGSSTFCGPNRSFPAPDGAHITAARQVIGQYKGPGDKAKILASLSRKEKVLGCEAGKDTADPKPAEDADALPPTQDSLKDMEDSELRSIFHAAELELIERKQSVKRECSDCALHIEESDQAKTELKTAQDKLTEANQTLEVLRGELKRSWADYATQVDEYVELGTQLHTIKAEKVALVGVLTQKYDNLENAMQDIKESNIDTLTASIMDSFNLDEAALKLNDGMARKPEGEVEDPVIDTDGDNAQLPEGLSEPAKEAIKNIKTYIDQGEEEEAKRIFVHLKNLDMFTDDLTFESLLKADNGAAE